MVITHSSNTRSSARTSSMGSAAGVLGRAGCGVGTEAGTGAGVGRWDGAGSTASDLVAAPVAVAAGVAAAGAAAVAVAEGVCVCDGGGSAFGTAGAAAGVAAAVAVAVGSTWVLSVRLVVSGSRVAGSELPSVGEAAVAEMVPGTGLRFTRMVRPPRSSESDAGCGVTRVTVAETPTQPNHSASVRNCPSLSAIAPRRFPHPPPTRTR